LTWTPRRFQSATAWDASTPRRVLTRRQDVAGPNERFAPAYVGFEVTRKSPNRWNLAEAWMRVEPPAVASTDNQPNTTTVALIAATAIRMRERETFV
jgi:hypothetical protein